MHPLKALPQREPQTASFTKENKEMNKPVNKVYRKLASKNDPRISLRVPQEVHDDLIVQAKRNARSKAEEIIARLIVTLQHNEEFMAHDRLMRLIFSKKLTYKADDRKDS